LSSSMSIQRLRFLADNLSSHFSSFPSLHRGPKIPLALGFRGCWCLRFWWRSAAISDAGGGGDLGRWEWGRFLRREAFLVGVVWAAR
jgi:hypothetical protein